MVQRETIGKLRKIIIFPLAFVCVLGLTACGKPPASDAVEMTVDQEDDHMVVIWEDRRYVPFCAVSGKECGAQLGFLDGDENNRIYEYNGYSADEWLINAYIEGRYVLDPMLLREVSVNEIPDGLESEYQWNNLSSGE